MYIISTAYSDNTADVTNILSLETKFCTEKELINLSKQIDILGLSTDDRKIIKIESYSFTTCVSEAEAREYAGVNTDAKYMNIDGYCFVFKKTHEVVPVGYYVLHWTEYEQSYLSKKGYTPYMRAAKIFTKEEAGKKAAMMNRKHKSNYWITQRVIL